MTQDRPSRFPVLFLIEGASRHELLLLSPESTLSSLQESMLSLLTTSPNTQEFMGKYRDKSKRDAVKEVHCLWGRGEGGNLFPKKTKVTEENVQAVLLMMRERGGRDVLDVTLAREAIKEEEAKK